MLIIISIHSFYNTQYMIILSIHSICISELLYLNQILFVLNMCEMIMHSNPVTNLLAWAMNNRPTEPTRPVHQNQFFSSFWDEKNCIDKVLINMGITDNHPNHSYLNLQITDLRQTQCCRQTANPFSLNILSND